jgi:hypothetical protein
LLLQELSQVFSPSFESSDSAQQDFFSPETEQRSLLSLELLEQQAVSASLPHANASIGLDAKPNIKAVNIKTLLSKIELQIYKFFK